MNETPNFLIRLGEALGPVGSLVFLLLLSGGAVWGVMSIRRNRDDHARIEKKVDTGFERLEKKIDAVVEHLEGKIDVGVEHLEAKIDVGVECVGGKIESSRKETRAESKETRAETRAELRSIIARLDQLIGRKPPDQPG